MSKSICNGEQQLNNLTNKLCPSKLDFILNGWTALQDDDMRNQDWPKSTLMHDGFDDDGGGDDGDDNDDGDDDFCKMVDDDDVLEDA